MIDLYATRPIDPMHRAGLERWDRINFEILCRMPWWQILAEYL